MYQALSSRQGLLRYSPCSLSTSSAQVKSISRSSFKIEEVLAGVVVVVVVVVVVDEVDDVDVVDEVGEDI